MNIKGILKLQENKLPLPRAAVIFRNIQDIPLNHLDKYGDSKKWALNGFDDRILINDSPYKIKDYKYEGFSRLELNNIFNDINKKMDENKIPLANRVFLLCESFFSWEIVFSGHAVKREEVVYIDILNSDSPYGSGRPDFSFSIALVNKKYIFNESPDEKLYPHMTKIVNDLKKFDGTAYIDFTLLKDGYFFYHNLSMH